MSLHGPNALYKVRAELQKRIAEAERKIGELNHAISQTRAILVILAQRDNLNAGPIHINAKPELLLHDELEQMTIEDLTAVKRRIDNIIRQKGWDPDHGTGRDKLRR